MTTLRHRGTTSANTYRDIPIFAARGLHEACMDLVRRYLPGGGKVLDIAAGAGAFTQRLLDAGYEVAANDIDPLAWRVPSVKPWTFDLNRPLPDDCPSHAFDLVVAIEIIEHLRDPQLLLEHCKRFCRKGGLLIITTPNVTNAASYIRYIQSGRFEYFDEKLYETTGHITLLPHWLIEKHFNMAGLKVIERGCAGQYHNTRDRWKHTAKDLIRQGLQVMLRGDTPRDIATGVCLRYILRCPS